MDFKHAQLLINKDYPNVRVSNQRREPSRVFMSSAVPDSGSPVQNGSSIDDLKRKYIGNVDIKGGPTAFEVDGDFSVQPDESQDVDVRIIEDDLPEGVAKDSGVGQRTVIVTRDGVKGVQG